MRLIKEIKSKEGILHFKRWRMLKTRWFEIYIHGIYQKDDDNHLHNHPWNMFTIILWGSYIEQFLCKKTDTKKCRVRRFLDFKKMKTTDFHKVRKLTSNKVFTLAIVGKRSGEDWGYHTEIGFVDHISYRKNK